MVYVKYKDDKKLCGYTDSFFNNHDILTYAQTVEYYIHNNVVYINQLMIDNNFSVSLPLDCRKNKIVTIFLRVEAGRVYYGFDYTVNGYYIFSEYGYNDYKKLMDDINYSINGYNKDSFHCLYNDGKNQSSYNYELINPFYLISMI